jgi:hypothetical protein
MGQVSAFETDCRDADANLARADLRIGHIEVLENRRRTVFENDSRFHRKRL